MKPRTTPSPYANQANAMANLAALRGGAAMEDLAQAVHEATAAVRLTKKKAKVTLSIIIEPADKKAPEVDRVWLEDEIAVKLPPSPKKNTLLFVEPEKGTLTERDPQTRIFEGARAVAQEPAAEPRAIGKDAAAGEARALAS